MTRKYKNRWNRAYARGSDDSILANFVNRCRLKTFRLFLQMILKLFSFSLFTVAKSIFKFDLMTHWLRIDFFNRLLSRNMVIFFLAHMCIIVHLHGKHAVAESLITERSEWQMISKLIGLSFYRFWQERRPMTRTSINMVRLKYQSKRNTMSKV